jgi:outer membrane protein TolC
VASTELFLQAGRTEIRDLLEAQEALISAQNSLSGALVGYRVTELQLQRDMGVLAIDAKGLWREYQTNGQP